jgi:hypothetical protein
MGGFEIAAKIGAELRNQYILGYHPSNKAHEARWRKIKIKLRTPKGLPPLNVYAKTGYYAPNLWVRRTSRFALRISETFKRLATLIQLTEHHGVRDRLGNPVGAVPQTGQRDSRFMRRNECLTVFRISF